MKLVIEHIKNTPALSSDVGFFDNYKDSSIAVVGNGGVILDHGDGEAIDSHTMVIRCNQTPLEEYTNHVGARTDVRMVNSHYFTALKGTDPPSHENFIPRMKSIHPRFDENYLYTLENEILIVKYGVDKSLFVNEIRQIQEKNNKVIFLDPRFYQLGTTILGTHPTNGFMAMMFALKFFKDVSYYGFGFYNESKKHYYQTIQEHLDSAPCHNNNMEKEFFTQLKHLGLAKERGL